MKLTREDDCVAVRCPAKLNLFLEVHGRRPDGYHEIETVMQAVTLYDDIELRPRTDGRIVLECSDPDLPAGPENLVCRAAERVRRATGLSAGVSISLEKRIPAGAGLGGGSSDAAGVLAGINELFGLRIGRERLSELAAGLGSDIPFFLLGGTALCRGRGEEVIPAPAAWTGHYVICCPDRALATGEVYENLARFGLTSETRSASFMLEFLAHGDVASARAGLFNRLGEVALSLAPEAARARDALAAAASAAAPAACLVTGSGSAVYALLESAVRAAEAAERVRDQEVGRVFLARSEAEGGESRPRWSGGC